MSREYEAMEVEKWVNLEDIADHLSVSTDTVRNWIKSGKIPYYRAGKRYKFRISEVDEWLKSGKIEMRMYPDEPIHAKVYILRKDPEHVPDQFGSVITGSSNFSMAGLQNNLEFNVELKDSHDVKFALDKFEELWKQGVDITEAYISTVDDKTWMRGDITPYEIYLKTIYEYFKEEINTDKEELAENILPDGFMRLQYQLDAVIQAKRILEAHDGVFISDVVGLGKTYICSMLAKILKKGGNW